MGKQVFFSLIQEPKCFFYAFMWNILKKFETDTINMHKIKQIQNNYLKRIFNSLLVVHGQLNNDCMELE